MDLFTLAMAKNKGASETVHITFEERNVVMSTIATFVRDGQRDQGLYIDVVKDETYEAILGLMDATCTLKVDDVILNGMNSFNGSWTFTPEFMTLNFFGNEVIITFHTNRETGFTMDDEYNGSNSYHTYVCIGLTMFEMLVQSMGD